MTYAVVDLETTTYTSFKRKANPFNPLNWIVYAGWQHKDDAAPQMLRFSAEHQDHSWFIKLLVPANKFIVGQNLKFDMLYLLRDPAVRGAWMQWVEQGGLIWDTQLAEYLLDGQVQASHMLSLDELAVRYGGDLKVDEVKALWEAGVQTQDINPELIERYLIGETLPNGQRREGDIGNTKLVFLGQLKRAQQQGQSRSVMLNLGSLVASVEMEFNGMYVDKAKGEELAKDLEQRLGEALARLNTYLPADLPFQFNWTSRHQLSPLIFGGKVKYQRRVYKLENGGEAPVDQYNAAVDGPIECPQMDELHYVLTSGKTMVIGEYEARLLQYPDGLSDKPPERERYKGGKNAGEFKTKKVKVPDRTRPKSASRDFEYAFPGVTEPKPEWASSDEGLWSVASEVIEELGNRNIPFLKDLAAVKKMDKDLGTYFIRWNETKGEHVGMLTLVQDDSIIHHGINHTSTVTGRFSSSNPNLQNIPKGNKSAVKQVFVSRHRADGCIIQSDFSSLEVYVQAILTKCGNLIADLKAGIDLHVMRLSLKEHMDYQEVFNLCKGYVDANGVHHAPVEEWDYKRTGAKVFSFQRAYGAGANKIADSTGMPLEEVEALIEAEKLRYPETESYFEARAKEITANRMPTNRMVPHPKMPAVMCQLGISRVCTPDGKRYTYLESPAPEFMVKRGVRASFSPTEIKNYEVQGTGAEWMKAAMWLAVRRFYRERNFGGLALLVNTVHDAQYVDAHESVKLRAAQLLHACMLEASTLMEWWFGWPLPLPVPSDTMIGANMGEEKPVDGLLNGMPELRSELRSLYINNHVPSFN
jgi:DNA polymerase I-like protein with 3'-5' exonuclease and polymerase domains